MGSLDGEVAVVTGARHGIGAAIARGLADAGARVAVTHHHREVAEGLAAELGGDHAGFELDVRSNLADPSPQGWRVRFRHEGPCPVCGDRCKRRSLPDERPLVFVGDGYSDRCASLACDRVFARDGLARYLQDEGVSYAPFDTLDDVAAALS